MHPLTVDGAEIAIDSAEFQLEGSTIRFDEVTQERTLTLAMNRAITVRVTGTRLEPGAHKIGMGFDAPGLGTLSFDFTDTVANE